MSTKARRLRRLANLFVRPAVHGLAHRTALGTSKESFASASG